MNHQPRKPPPRFVLRAKRRTRDGSARAFRIAAGWQNDKGINVSLEAARGKFPGVAAIVLNDGTRITSESHFLNWIDLEAEQQHFRERDAQRAGDIVDQLSNPPTAGEDLPPLEDYTHGGDDDDIPFE